MKTGFDYHRDRNIVETSKGAVRGYISEDVYCFAGIPYAKAERFCEAEEAEPWEGVLDTTDYGSVAPLLHPMNMGGQLLTPHRMQTQDEYCQYLNIWTPVINRDAKLPVMVWLHGGGYFEGSSIEQDAYDGKNLALNEQVVVVTLNHRLNILGYLDVAVLGETYENSGNAGMTDIVEALKWIQKNIHAFGGDSDNVTLFGQSGGGGKIITLMQIPLAEGLFQKAIIQSGVLPVDRTPAAEVRAGNAMLVKAMAEYLQLKDTMELTTVVYDRLREAYLQAKRRLRKQGIVCGGNGPVPNDYYKGDPDIAGFTEMAKKIPIICGSTFAEICFAPDIVDRDQIGQEEVQRLLEQKYTKEGVDKLIPAFQEAFPDKPLADLLVIDHMIRRETLRFTEQFAKEGKRPIFNYLFTFDFLYNGRKAAWHCSEIPFVFHNIDRIPVCKIPGARETEEQMCHTFAAFARTKEFRNIEELPGGWKPYQTEKRHVMRFDRESKEMSLTDCGLQELLEKYLPVFMPDFED
ncbi:MAG: carboxylesterase/lipase family protein [Blautia sp.]|nr:carboxylesterase/lipase family protein [Blautia sp.]